MKVLEIIDEKIVVFMVIHYVIARDKEVLFRQRESTYIPVGVVHALENPGKIPLELVEVQSGSYLAEDDIMRFSDRYGRSK